MIGRNFFAKRKLRAVTRRIVADSYEDNAATTIDYAVREINTQFKLGLAEEDLAKVIETAIYVTNARPAADKAQLVGEVGFLTFVAASMVADRDGV